MLVSVARQTVILSRTARRNIRRGAGDTDDAERDTDRRRMPLIPRLK